MGNIKLDKRNYRVHSQKNKDLIKKSLTELGAGRSVVIDSEDTLVAGNGVFEQAQKIGMPTKIIETDGSELIVVKRTDLKTDDEKRKKLALADNSISDTSEFDFDVMANDFMIEDLADWGVELPEMDFDDAKEVVEDNFDEEKDKVETRCQKGDIWQLGEHRLMCGDSTKAENVAELMDGEKADITFTSPPYNVVNGFNTGQKLSKGYLGDKKIYNEYEDNRTDDDYAKFLTDVLKNSLDNSDDAFFNIGYVKGALIGTGLFLGKNAHLFAGAITWKKNVAYMPFLKAQFGILGNITEPIYFFNKNKRRSTSHPQWKQGEVMYNIFETKQNKNEYAGEHNAVFPVELPAHFIKNFSEKSVLDLFGGTGTTMIAAEQLNRKCFMMELDAHYCDVIIARWEKLTGNKAVKL